METLINRSKLLLNAGIIIFGGLFIFESIVLLDSLPRLLGHPSDFPIKATCNPYQLKIVNNLCLNENSETHFSEWNPCFVADFIINYTASEPVLTNNQSVIELQRGQCHFMYPEIYDQANKLISQLTQKIPLNQTYDCWTNTISDSTELNSVTEQCYIVNTQTIKTEFWISQIVMGSLLFIDIVFMVIMYWFYRKRDDPLESF